jgi:chromodomain-helicase-DNA-binding protein 7
VPDFCNGRQLRDYQLQSLEWNIRNWWGNVNCILGDEVRVLGLYIGWG